MSNCGLQTFLQTKFTTELAMDQLKLKGYIKVLAEEIREFMKLGDIDSFEERLANVLEMEEKLQKYTTLGDLYNNREQVSSCYMAIIIFHRRGYGFERFPKHFEY